MRKMILACTVMIMTGAVSFAADVVDAKHLPDRWFISPEVWANPMENWCAKDGAIVTTHAPQGRAMTLQHLTCTLDESAAPAEMDVLVQATSPAGTKGSAGFVLGIRMDDPMDDYRSRLLFGEGLFAGINTAGELFIGADTRAKLEQKAMDLTAGPVKLAISMRPGSDGRFTLRLTASDPASGAQLGEIEKTSVPPGRLAGNVALFVNAPYAIAQCGGKAIWSFRNWRLEGIKFAEHPEHAFGPIFWSQYTLSDKVLKLTAQMAPIGEQDIRTVGLEIQRGGAWKEAARAEIQPLSWTAHFRIENWDDSRDTPYRLTWTQRRSDGVEKAYEWQGTIRRDPGAKPVITSGIFCCFMDYLFPNQCVVENTRRQNPDVLVFTGDQIYENVGGWGILRTGPIDRMCVNYLRKLALWGWSFRDLMKDRPTITMPDDHDVYQGNLWGDGGKEIPLDEWKAPSGYGDSPNVGSVGGYVQPIEFLKAVERTQVAHLPDPATAKTYEQGLGAYYTSMNYGGVGMAILEDRKFKTGPQQIEHRHAGPRPDHISEPNMAEQVNDPNAKLLGDDQLAFLRNWTSDWRGQQMKVAISQTVYCGVATHHGSYDNFLLGDMDCGGWPQAGRNKAIDALRRGGVMLLAGDQHLPSLVRHGIDQPGDAMVSFVTPAGATGYQRWWCPEDCGIKRMAGGRHEDRPDTGLYRDGFGNIMDVLAVGNPPETPGNPDAIEELGARKSAGWGLVEMDKASGEIRVQAWRVRPGLNVNDLRPEDQFPGWPMSFGPLESYGVTAPKLPEVVQEGGAPRSVGPVVRVLDADGAFVSAGRMRNGRFTPTVYGPGAYTVEVLSTKDDATVVKTFTGIKPGAADTKLTVPGEAL